MTKIPILCMLSYKLYDLYLLAQKVRTDEKENGFSFMKLATKNLEIFGRSNE